VVSAAALGAILGNTIGFWIGREGGYRLLLRYGPVFIWLKGESNLASIIPAPWRRNHFL